MLYELFDDIRDCEEKGGYSCAFLNAFIRTF